MMKIFLVLSLLSILSHTASAQPQAISLEFNDASFTRNVNLTYHHSFFKNSFSVYGGLKYLFNSNKLFLGRVDELESGYANENYVFYQPLTETLEDRLGLKVGIEKTLIAPSENASVYGMYDFQYSLVVLKVVAGGVDSFGNLVSATFPFNPGGEVRIYEHYLGLGIRHRIRKSLFLKIFATAGVFKLKEDAHATHWNGEDSIPNNWTFARMFGIGLEYRFINVIANKTKK